MRVRPTRVAAAMAAALVLSSAAAAQTVTIPDEPAHVLVRGPGLALPPKHVLLLTVPPSFPADLLPEIIDVRAAAVGDSVNVVVLFVEGSADAARARDARRLQMTGWLSTSLPIGALPATAADLPSSFCRQDDVAHIATVPARNGGYFVRISTGRDTSRACMPRGSVLANINLPRLRPPAAAKVVGSGSSGSADGAQTSTRIQIDWTSAELHDHYLRQVTASGWQLQGQRLEDGTLSVSRFAAVEDPGAIAVLTVIALEEEHLHDVVLRLSRPRSTRTPLPMNPLPRESTPLPPLPARGK